MDYLVTMTTREPAAQGRLVRLWPLPAHPGDPGRRT